MSVVASSLIAQVKVEGDTETKQKLGEVSASVDKAGGVIGGLKGAFSGAFAWISEGGLGNVISAFDTLRGAFGNVLQESLDAQDELAQTNKVLESTHDASGMTADAIVNLAGSFSHLTKFTDDQVQIGENLLLTFTNIGKNVFPLATQTMLDLSQAMGQDVKSSAIQLGKALNDPLTGMSALQRVGVTFDSTEQKLIKTYMQHNELAKAQGVILNELTKEFGGSAEAAGKTFGGQMAILNQRIDDVKQSLGDALLPIVTEFVGVVSNEVLPVLNTAGDWLASTGVPAFEKFASGIYESVTQSKPFRDILAEIGADLKIVGSAFQEIFFPIQKVQDVTKPLTDTFDRATGAIHTVSTALTPLTDTFDRAKGVIGSTTVATKPLLDSFDRATVIIPKVTTFITKTTEAVNPLVAIFKYWKPVLEDVFKDVQILAGDVLTFATGVVDAAEKSGFFQSALQFLHDELPVVGSFLVNVGGAINQNLLPPLESLITNVGSAAAGFIDWADKSGVAKTTLDTLGASIQLTTEILGPLIAAVSDVVGWLGGGGAGTDTLVFALSAAATAFTLLKIADTTAQFGSFISKLQEGDGIITNLASSVKDKLARAFDDFMANQAPHLKASMDSVKVSAEEAAVAEEEVAAAPADESAAGWFARLEGSLGGVGTAADETSVQVGGIGIASETSAGEVAVSSTEMEGSLAGVGTAATGAEGSIAAVGTSAATAGAGVVSGFGVVAAGIMTAGIAAIVGIEAYMLKDATPALVNSWNNADFKEPPPFRTAAAQMNYDSYNTAHHVSSNFSDMNKNGSSSAQTMNKNVQGSFDQMNTKSVASVQTLSDRAMAILDKLNQEGSGQMSALDSSSKGYWNDLADWIANNPINAVINIDENPINSQGKAFSPTQLKDYRKNAYASGTDYVPQTGRYLVGEKGPEEVVLPRGAQVIPNDQLSHGGSGWGGSGWGGGGTSQPMHVHVHIADQEFEYLTSAMMDNATRQTRLRHARRQY